jgi:dTDP-4-amino-4,6-dideoxygalactose transaminase
MTAIKPGSLAIFGGTPRFAVPLHVGRPNIGNRMAFQRRVEGAFDRHWLTNDGDLLQELESRLSAYLGVPHCVAVSSGTMALSLAARGLGLTGEVIVPSFTFVATVHALSWQGLIPVFCDIDPQTHHIDVRLVESLITEHTTGIVGVHLWGEPMATDALDGIAQRHGLRLLYDAAHAFGVVHGASKIGNFGDAEAFSFHATKVFNTFEGGAVATNDGDLADRIRMLRNFGFGSNERPEALGINGKMHEISAAMGLTNLESFEDFVACNRRNYLTYRSELQGVDGLHVLPHVEHEQRNHHYIVMELEQRDNLLTRDRLLQVLRAENVLARRYYWPGCHNLEPYRSDIRNAALNLPATDSAARRVLALPTGTGISTTDIAIVCDIIRTALTASDKLRGD